MPPSGKMPVSTAALRTTSTSSLMSTRLSRSAEYSMVKCGMGCLRVVSGEIAADRAVSAIIGLDCVALAGLDRTDEGTRQHDLTRLERKPVRRDLVGEPGDSGRRMIEHAGGKAGLLQLAVAEAQRTDPAQIGIERPDRPPAEHDAGVRCVVGDGVVDLARCL